MSGHKTVRVIDELGRVVLPMEMRDVMGWGEKTTLEIWVNATDHSLVIKRHIAACAYCGRKENLKTYQKKCICSVCQEEISRL